MKIDAWHVTCNREHRYPVISRTMRFERKEVMSKVTRNRLAAVVAGLSVGLLAQQASATEEIVVYGSASSVFKVEPAMFRAEIDNYVRTLNSRASDYARSEPEAHAGTESRAREQHDACARLSNRTSGHHSSPRGVRWPSRTAVLGGPGFRQRTWTSLRPEEHGCSCTRPSFFSFFSRLGGPTAQRGFDLEILG